MAVVDWQVAFNGVTLGQGTSYRILGQVGFRGLPTLVNKDLPKAVRDGSYAGFDVNVERILQITVLVGGYSGAWGVGTPTASQFETNLAALEAATIPIFDPANLLPVTAKLPNRTVRYYVGRPRQHDDPLDPTYIRNWSKVTVGWQCPDPTIYDDPATTTSVAAGTPQTVTNAGNWPSKPTITVTPTTSPVTITNSGDGGQIVLATSTVGSIPSPCVIDTLHETVVDGSGNNRFDVVDPSTTWLSLVKGSNTLGITGGSMSVVWRSAWIT